MHLISNGFAFFTFVLWGCIVVTYLFGSDIDQSEPFFVERLGFSKNKEGRELIIGNVNGCFKELQQLIKSSNFIDNKDKLFFVGDMIGTCPYSPQVVQFAMDHNAECIRGPLEDLIVAWYIADESQKPKLDDNQMKIAESLTEDQLDFLLTCPLYIEIKEYNSLIIHEGLNPNQDLSAQSEDILKKLGQNEGKIQSLLDYWLQDWIEDKLIIFSSSESELLLKHSPDKELNVININSSVHGKYLSAFAIPDMKVLQTPPRQTG